MTQEIDYTKYRCNKKQRIVKCPKCGRVGRLSRYTNGTANITHKGHIDNLGIGFMIDDYCFFGAGEYTS